jgi:hypothetical protein
MTTVYKKVNNISLLWEQAAPSSLIRNQITCHCYGNKCCCHNISETKHVTAVGTNAPVITHNKPTTAVLTHLDRDTTLS